MLCLVSFDRASINFRFADGKIAAVREVEGEPMGIEEFIVGVDLFKLARILRVANPLQAQIKTEVQHRCRELNLFCRVLPRAEHKLLSTHHQGISVGMPKAQIV